MQQGSGLAIRGDTRAVRGILLDLEGVVYVRDTLLPGSRDAISRIQAAGIPLKFITNTTRRPRRRIAGDLAGMGLRAALDDTYTPAAIARDFLADRNLTPFLVVHPDLREDFSGLRTGAEEAVVIGDAGEFFTYDLNCAGEGSGLLVGTAKLNSFSLLAFPDGSPPLKALSQE
ncbi:MAG: hypothetical protein WA231_24525 [Methylocella sp.]